MKSIWSVFLNFLFLTIGFSQTQSIDILKPIENLGIYQGRGPAFSPGAKRHRSNLSSKELSDTDGAYNRSQSDEDRIQKLNLFQYITGNKRYYEVLSFSRPVQKQPVIIFLHGLKEQNESMSDAIKQAWEQKIHDHQFILALPLGKKGAFENDPNAYGWFPNYAAENLEFLQEMVNQIRKNYNVDQQCIILYGYSNGAYFVANQLQQNTASPFSHYWLQGGGVNEPIKATILRKPTVLQVGINDHWHFATVESLNQHLNKNGWTTGENLMFQKLNSGHDFSFDEFDKAYQFLNFQKKQ